MRQHSKMPHALQRTLRRAQLWHASRIACDDEATWRAAWPTIGAEIDAILFNEFGT